MAPYKSSSRGLLTCWTRVTSGPAQLPRDTAEPLLSHRKVLPALKHKQDWDDRLRQDGVILLRLNKRELQDLSATTETAASSLTAQSWGVVGWGWGKQIRKGFFPPSFDRSPHGSFPVLGTLPFKAAGWQVTMLIRGRYWDSKAAADIYCAFYMLSAVYELELSWNQREKQCYPYLLSWIKAKGGASKMPVLGKQKPAQKIPVHVRKIFLKQPCLFLTYHLILCTEMDII